MSTCLGITNQNKKCNNKVLSGHYCRFHKSQQITTKSTKMENNLINYDDNIGNDPCSICLCDVEEDDCHLICKHKHHTACIKQLHQPFCPVCKGPLEFKQNINIEEIKKKSIEDKIIKEKEQMEESSRIAKELHEQLNEPNDKEQELIEKVLEESLLSVEIDEYEQIAKMVEYSCLYAEKEEELLLERVYKENIALNKHDWCDEDFKTLMKGQKNRIIQLK